MSGTDDPELSAAPTSSNAAKHGNEAGNGSLFSQRNKKNPAGMLGRMVEYRSRYFGWIEIGISILGAGLIFSLLDPAATLPIGWVVAYVGGVVAGCGVAFRLVTNFRIKKFLQEDLVDDLKVEGPRCA